ncbi:DUF1345 domain-containing protein [Paenibacillus aestuarii]|uniref:DUF1345 domain-containing protein n=1 Tax=Paenibacillus aestuarii TaxID=516965 RepID=A0ABW0KIT8_9BACL|nr:DUF1345 domain-containing protein [Paenibacillus aestuarii]
MKKISISMHEIPKNIRIPRWSFLIAILIIGVMLASLPEMLTVGPSWIIPALSFFFLVPLVYTVARGHHAFTRFFTFIIISIMTLGLISSVIFLIHTLFAHLAVASSLFRNAALLWVANIIVFTIWYWEVDQGGPIRRHTGYTQSPDFLFPQMTEGWTDWKPSFFDYLFLAFNTNTAFSPTDTLVMSGRAKLLMMTQAAISLVILAVLAARAVNIV